MAGFLKQFYKDLRNDYILNDRRNSFLFRYLKQERSAGESGSQNDSYSRLAEAFAAADIDSEEGRRAYFLYVLELLGKSRKPLLPGAREAENTGRRDCKTKLLTYAQGAKVPGLTGTRRWDRKVCKRLLEHLEQNADIEAPDKELLCTLHEELSDSLLLQEAEDYLYNLESGRKNSRDMAILEAYLDTHYTAPASGEASGPGAGLRLYNKKSASGGGGRVWDDERIAQLERFYQTLREGEYGEALIPICIDPRTGAGLFFLGKEYLWETGFDSRGICCIACLYVQDLDLIVEGRRATWSMWSGGEEELEALCGYPNVREALVWFGYLVEGETRRTPELPQVDLLSYFQDGNGQPPPSCPPELLCYFLPPEDEMSSAEESEEGDPVEEGREAFRRDERMIGR